MVDDRVEQILLGKLDRLDDSMADLHKKVDRKFDNMHERITTENSALHTRINTEQSERKAISATMDSLIGRVNWLYVIAGGLVLTLLTAIIGVILKG